MKKVFFIGMASLFLVACQSNTPAPSNENKSVNEYEDNNNDVANDINEETSIEKNDKPQNSDNESNEKNEDSNGDNTITNDKNENNEQESGEVEDSLIELGKDIFQAQFDQDTAFLQSILSSGTTIDEETFYFENVTYPHEQPFFTEETAANIEHRYTHENDVSSYIVGFAAFDKVNEFSFVIDFEFIQEDGEWKMKDMEVNK